MVRVFANRTEDLGSTLDRIISKTKTGTWCPLAY